MDIILNEVESKLKKGHKMFMVRGKTGTGVVVIVPEIIEPILDYIVSKFFSSFIC